MTCLSLVAPEPELFRALSLTPILAPQGLSPNTEPTQAKTWAFKLVGSNKHLVTFELEARVHVFSDFCAFLSEVSELVLLPFTSIVDACRGECVYAHMYMHTHIHTCMHRHTHTHKYAHALVHSFRVNSFKVLC